MGPVLFSLDTTQLGMVVEKYDTDRQLFADDTRLYASFHPDQLTATVVVQNFRIASMRSRTGCLPASSHTTIERLGLFFMWVKDATVKKYCCSLTIGESEISLSSSVRDLELVLCSGLIVRDHIRATVQGVLLSSLHSWDAATFCDCKSGKFYCCGTSAVATGLLQQLSVRYHGSRTTPSSACSQHCSKNGDSHQKKKKKD